jgi:hypothetical protein
MLDNCASYSQAGYLNSQASVFNGYLNSNNYKDAPRGAWYIKDISGNSVGDGVASKTVTVTVHVTEPIGILSPFLFAKQGAGIQGVQAINLNLTLDATCSRSWRSTSTIQAVTCSYQNSQMLVTFLSPKASQMVKYAPRNIVPYSQLQVYKTTPVTSAAGSVSTPSVQLSSIPKMAFLYVRPVTRNYNTPDFCLPIAKINCLFNGRNGLLSGATKQQLYQMSVESGLQMNWQEFSGVANVNSVNGVPVPFFTQSGPLILTFATHLECANEYDAPSAIGAYNIQFNVNFENPSAFAGNVELYMVLVNEGLFSSERSSSSSYTSILSKSDVMGVLSDVPEPNVVTLNEPADAITGGARRYHVKAMGRSAGGRSGGKLHSRLM